MLVRNTRRGDVIVFHSRAHNAANELTQINSSSANVAHDAAGNMTTVPLTASPTAGHITCTYDAWNRVVTATDSASAPVGRYFYDGLGRRIAKAALSPTNSYDRTDFYYNENWQVLEEQKAPGYASLATATSATPIPHLGASSKVARSAY